MTIRGSLAERSLERRAGWVGWLLAGDRWIPLAFVAGFLIMLAANGIMVFVAFDSWTGLTDAESYKHGLDYDDALDQASAQAALGWKVEGLYKPGADGAGRVEVHLATNDGAPLATAHVNAVLQRSGREDLDQALTLAWQGDGVFGADVALPVPGVWDMEVEISRGGDIHLSRYRLMVSP
jgi:nitrogen fixation protein FixH